MATEIVWVQCDTIEPSAERNEVYWESEFTGSHLSPFDICRRAEEMALEYAEQYRTEFNVANGHMLHVINYGLKSD